MAGDLRVAMALPFAYRDLHGSGGIFVPVSAFLFIHGPGCGGGRVRDIGRALEDRANLIARHHVLPSHCVPQSFAAV